GADRALGDLLAGLHEDRRSVPTLQLRPDSDVVRDDVLTDLFVHRRDRDLLVADSHPAGVAGLDDGGLTSGQLLALHDLFAVLDQDLHARLQRIGDLELLSRGDPDLPAALLADDL